MLPKISKLLELYSRMLKFLVFAMLSFAGIGIFVMIAATCADVLLRNSRFAFVGAYDIVKVAGALTLALALPYTTAVKGHVAIEYFFHKLSRTWRLIIDTICRLLSIALFTFLAWRCFMYGSQLRRIGQVTQTLQMPVFWVLYVIGFCSLMVVLVTLYHLIQPNKEMIKP